MDTAEINESARAIRDELYEWIAVETANRSLNPATELPVICRAFIAVTPIVRVLNSGQPSRRGVFTVVLVAVVSK